MSGQTGLRGGGTAGGPLVSVIVPVFNSAAYLDACVTSILEQDYPRLEVILVDDGSSDGSGAVCDRLGASDERVVVIHRENGGIAAAQNSGLDVATGELVTFCDNDDLMSTRMIGRLVEILLATDADMSCCRWHNVGASNAAALREANAEEAPGRFISFNQPGRRYQEVFSVVERRLRHRELEYFSEANWGKLYRRELFDGLRFPEGSYAQDVAVAMDLYQRMRVVASCDDALYYWLQRSDSVSHNLRTTRYYHDIVRAHGRAFESALGSGILPARAYFGLSALRFERRSATIAADRALYEKDRQYVASLKSRLTRRQRARCAVLRAVRLLEVQIYNLTVHRRS